MFLTAYFSDKCMNAHECALCFNGGAICLVRNSQKAHGNIEEHRKRRRAYP